MIKIFFLLIIIPILFGLIKKINISLIQQYIKYYYISYLIIMICVINYLDLNFFYNLGNFNQTIGIQYYINPIKTKLLTILYMIFIIMSYYNHITYFINTACNFLILSNDIFHTYIAIEILNIAIVLWLVQSKLDKQVIFNYMISCSAGACCILLGIAFIFMEYGYLNINLIHSSNISNYLISIGVLLKLPINKYIIHAYLKSPHTEYLASISSLALLFPLSYLFSFNEYIAIITIIYQFIQLIKSHDIKHKIIIYSSINSIFTLIASNFANFLIYDTIAKFILFRAYARSNFLLGMIAFALYIDAPISLYYFLAKIDLIYQLSFSMQILFIFYKVIIIYYSYDILLYFLNKKIKFDYTIIILLSMLLFYY